MSDETTDIEAEDEPETKQGRNWKALRERADAAESKVKDLESKMRKGVFREAGFDPESGVGKMLATLYEGDLEVEALKAFAKAEYGVEPGEPSVAVSPAADQIVAVQGRIDRLSAQSQPLAPPGGDDAIAARVVELEAKGDTESLMEAIALRDEWRKRQT